MAKRAANTQISKDSLSDGQGIWGEAAQASGPLNAVSTDISSRRMARPRSRRPLPGNHRLVPPRSNLNQQLQLPNFNQSESGTTASNPFTFGQQSNGTSTSASFPPFGTNNTGNNSGTTSSFNIPSSNFSFTMGQSAPTNNPFASLSAPPPQDHQQNQSFQGSIFSFSQPPQTSSSPSSFTLNNQPNGTSQSQSGPATNIFGSTSSSTAQSSDNANRLFQPSGAQQQQSVFGQSATPAMSNSFTNSSGVDAKSSEPSEPNKKPAVNIFGRVHSTQTSSNPSSNPLQSSTSDSKPANTSMSENATKPVTNIFGQPSSASSQQTSQSNSFFGQQSSFATQPSSSSTNIFGQPTIPKSDQPPLTTNIFNKSTAPLNQSNTVFEKPSPSGDQQLSETNVSSGGQGDPPTAPEWKPTTNLWGEDPDKRQPRSLQDIFGRKKSDSPEQSQANTDFSMMQTSPDNSPQPKQQSTDARPFAFLNPGDDQKQSSPSKNPNAPLGRSIFDKGSSPPVGLFGRMASSQPSQISGNAVEKPSSSESTGVSESKPKASSGRPIKSLSGQQAANQPVKFNPFSNLQMPPSTPTSAQASPPKPGFSFSSTTTNFSHPFAASAQPASELFKPLDSKVADSDKPGQSVNGNMLSPLKHDNVNQGASAGQAANLLKPFAATEASGSPFKSSSLNGQEHRSSYSASANSKAGTDHGQLPAAKMFGSQSAAAESTQNYSKAEGSHPEPSNPEEFNPMVMYIIVPRPPDDFTEEEKRQFVTGWRLKVLDDGARRFCERSMTDEYYERVKTFYRFKRQAIFAANGGPMLDLDPRTGEKRKKALDLSQGEPNKRVRSENGQAHSPSTTPTNSPAKSTNLFQTSSSPNKRKASDSIGVDDQNNKSEKRSRASTDSMTSQQSPPAESQTSGLFKDILQKDKSATPSFKAPVSGSKLPASNSLNTSTKALSSDVPKVGAESSSGSTTTPFKVPNFGVTSGSSSFLSQFGQAAKQVEEKDKQKRKADDYDSDEEDETAWERRDAEEQRAKRKKIEEEAAKAKTRFVPGKGFVLETPQQAAVSDASDGEGSNSSFSILDPQHPSHQSNTTHNIFGHLSDVDSGIEGSKTGDADDEHDGSVETDEEAAPKPAGPKESSPSLFDRISRDNNGKPLRENSSVDSGLLMDGAAGSDSQATKSTMNSSNPPSFASSFAPAPAANHTPPKTNVFGLPSASSIASPFKTTSPTNPSTPASAEKGDHTWKPSEPIKFGNNTPTASTSSVQGTSTTDKPSINVASPSPTKAPLGSLFGTSTSSSVGENAAKQAPLFSSTTTTVPSNAGAGFGFGISAPKPNSNSLAPISNINSRATSPGLTTGESANESNADADDEGAEKHDQLDLTAVGPGEEDEDTLFEARAKASKWDDGKQEWIMQGLGPFRIMKHRKTGDTRILMRQDPNGRVLVNSNIFAGATYKAENKSTTRIPIMSAAGKLEIWIVKVGKDSNAFDLAATLEDNKRKD